MDNPNSFKIPKMQKQRLAMTFRAVRVTLLCTNKALSQSNCIMDVGPWKGLLPYEPKSKFAELRVTLMCMSIGHSQSNCPTDFGL